MRRTPVAAALASRHGRQGGPLASVTDHGEFPCRAAADRPPVDARAGSSPPAGERRRPPDSSTATVIAASSAEPAAQSSPVWRPSTKAELALARIGPPARRASAKEPLPWSAKPARIPGRWSLPRYTAVTV